MRVVHDKLAQLPVLNPSLYEFTAAITSVVENQLEKVLLSDRS